MIVETKDSRETFALGLKLGREARRGEVYALTGDLGTGKTVFAQGFAQGLGVRDIVTSPTFTLVQIYEDGRLPLYHFDVYRLGDPSEAEEIGFEEYVGGDGVALIEWAELVEELLPEDTVFITIEKVPERGGDFRRIGIRKPDEDHSA